MATHVNVHRRVGLGELRRRRDALITEWRRGRPGDHWPGHAGAIILLNDKTTRNYFIYEQNFILQLDTVTFTDSGHLGPPESLLYIPFFNKSICEVLNLRV